MTVEINNLIAKFYTVEDLLTRWLPIVVKDNNPNLDAFIPSNIYEQMMGTYDIVYAVQEEDTDLKYAYFCFSEDVGTDNVTHMFTLEKVVLDKGLTEHIEDFFLKIAGSLTSNPQNDYRIRIDDINLPLKRYNYEVNIQAATERLLKRVKAKKENKETDFFLQDRGIIKNASE